MPTPLEESESQIQAVLKNAIEKVKAANHDVLCADDLMVFLACEIVARDRTIAEAGHVIAKNISDRLNMDSRRREVALRAEVERLTQENERMQRMLDGAYE